jgi:hypothetical protein
MQSADSLSSTTTHDVNGDAVVDLTTTDVMVINGVTSRDHTVSLFNTDSSLRSRVVTQMLRFFPNSFQYHSVETVFSGRRLRLQSG